MPVFFLQGHCGLSGLVFVLMISTRLITPLLFPGYLYLFLDYLQAGYFFHQVIPGTGLVLSQNQYHILP